MVEFTAKELITSAIAIISLTFNIIQWQKQKNFYKPIYNALIGLFNEIKSKQIFYYGKQQSLETGVCSDKDSFSQFIRLVTIDFEGIKEHLVATLKTMDKSDTEIFKASDFGLTEAEKKQREEFFKRSKES